MDLKVLFIEDDEKLAKNLKKSFDNVSISGYNLRSEVITHFEDGISAIQNSDFDLVILDLYKDKGIKDEEAGIKVLTAIRQSAFIPVVFYTGHAYKITNLISEIVGVVSKGDGIEALTKEIERIINSKIAVLKSQIYGHLRESLRKYFWETVDKHKEVFVPGERDVSLGYLLLRRFANSLSKENIKHILSDENINPDKVHPMEFYVFPVDDNPLNEEYQSGEILEKNGEYYVILTPDCDFVLRRGGSRKADKILLAKAKQCSLLPDFIKYIELKNKPNRTPKEENEQLPNLKGILKQWIANNGGDKDRYFFLPYTPFISNLVIDFQIMENVEYNNLSSYRRIAKLDLPFAQSMISCFIRYYNRIGFPDIDSDYIIESINQT